MSLCWDDPCHAGAGEYPYYVAINVALKIVTMYSIDEEGNDTVPDRAFTCSAEEATSTGPFHTSDKYVWGLCLVMLVQQGKIKRNYFHGKVNVYSLKNNCSFNRSFNFFIRK
ncbi:MAG: hypothetical protein PHG19_12850 [Anaerotignum sp.]|nr:hypothetical protein [Anaerotignum sp.]